MENKNIPPFYVGQRVVRNRPHSWGMVAKGREYIVTAVFKSNCCPMWLVTVGVDNPYGGSKCHSCGRVEWYIGQMRFCATGFSPILENFQSISLSKILEEETRFIGTN